MTGDQRSHEGLAAMVEEQLRIIADQEREISALKTDTAVRSPSDDDEAPLGRRVTLTRASSIRPRPVSWGWQDRVPLGVAQLAGRT